MTNETIVDDIVRTFEDATAAGRIGCATEAEAAQFLREGLEQVERDHGLNVIPFPTKHSATGNEGGEA